MSAPRGKFLWHEMSFIGLKINLNIFKYTNRHRASGWEWMNEDRCCVISITCQIEAEKEREEEAIYPEAPQWRNE